MSEVNKEHEQLQKEVNKKGDALLGEIIEILSMKSLAKYFPYPISCDNLHIEIKGNVITIQGKQDTRIHCVLTIVGNVVVLGSANYVNKELSKTRSEAVIAKVDAVKGLFTFYDVTPFAIALESNGGRVALVSNTSRGRVVVIGK